jgi:heme exporter protein C
MSAVITPTPDRSPSAVTSALRGLLALFLWATLPLYTRRWVLLPALTGVTMMGLIVGAVLAAPREVIEGDVQRLMYLHVPSASAGTYLSFFIAAAASVTFLISRDIRWDAVARSAATVGVLFTIVTLATGAIWGKPIWGVYWTWDARLTATLVLLLIYTAYLLARSVAGPNDEQAARYAAIFALIGFLDIPLIHFSVDWWRTLHPQRIIFNPRPAVPGEMLLVLLVAFIAITFLMLWLITLRSESEQLLQRTDRMRARLDQREPA